MLKQPTTFKLEHNPFTLLGCLLMALRAQMNYNGAMDRVPVTYGAHDSYLRQIYSKVVGKRWA